MKNKENLARNSRYFSVLRQVQFHLYRVVCTVTNKWLGIAPRQPGDWRHPLYSPLYSPSIVLTINVDCGVTEGSHRLRVPRCHSLRLEVEHVELVRAVVELLLQVVEDEREVSACSALHIEVDVVA